MTKGRSLKGGGSKTSVEVVKGNTSELRQIVREKRKEGEKTIDSYMKTCV